MGALKDLKVLDFSTLLPGPFASLMLADMGAEVLKISSASKPDIVTDYPPFIEGTDISACQAWLGRNKKSMFLNLKTEEGVAIVKELVKEYDIVLEQFRPGVMDKLGIGYEDLKAVNPSVIYCSLTGYGQTGPLRDAAGHDINYMARSGIISHAGRK
ncbi:MAG: CoA transferase, partial [Mogibacterium sp.]|nr:CoA transferase [Mogibacterium sp.]